MYPTPYLFSLPVGYVTLDFTGGIAPPPPSATELDGTLEISLAIGGTLENSLSLGGRFEISVL